MLGEFWKSVAGSLADRWAAAGPALVFWVGTVLVWALGGRFSLSMPSSWLDSQTTVTQVAALIGALLVLAASTVAVSRLTTPALRLLEGYRWPRWADGRRAAMVTAIRLRHQADTEKWQSLQEAKDRNGTLPGAQEQAWAELDRRLHWQPADPDGLMPTRIGNILRAAETHPRDKYGLDSVAVWPRLWLVMPDTTRQELTAARSSLDATVTAALWSALFAVLNPTALLLTWPVTPWSWATLTAAVVAAVAGALVAVAAVRWWIPARAQVFGELVESAFDLHRTALYEQLRWPLPGDPAEEAETGRQVTEYLWRGSSEPHPRFTVTTR